LAKKAQDAQENDGRTTLIHSFIVRVWQEADDPESPEPTWRGHVTEIREGSKQYFNDLADIPVLIRKHLGK
jgi:hypothetical protein